MDISTEMNNQELARLQSQVDMFNKTLQRDGSRQQSLGKDDFLKVLITQLTHQDPTKPMEDKQFIAQMAQFSTLEQMTNMSKEFSQLSGLLAKGQALSLLGKEVTVAENEQLISGIVREIKGGDFPQLLINGKYYNFDQVESVKE